METDDNSQLVKLGKGDQTLLVGEEKGKLTLLDPSHHAIVKDNELAKSSYKLTLTGNRLIHWLISKIKPEDENFHTYSIEIKKFMEVTGVDDQGLYSEIPKILTDLTTRSIVLKNVGGKIGKDAYMAWLAHAEHHKGEGIISLMFHPDLKPYLLQLKEKFTKYNFETLLRLDTFYAQRFYELLKMDEYKGHSTLTLEGLKDYFQIRDAQYAVYGHLKNRVIAPSIKKINAKTELSITYKEKKLGRKVVALEWAIRNKDTSEAIQVKGEPTSPLHVKLEGIGATTVKANSLLNIYGTEEVELAIEELAKHPRVKNKTNYLEGILKNREKVNSSSHVYSPSTEPTLTLIFEGEFSAYRKALADKIGHASYKSWFVDNEVQFSLKEDGSDIVISCPTDFVADHILTHYKAEMDKAWEETKDIYIP